MVLQDSVEASSDMRDAGDVCLDEVWEDGMLSVSAWLGPCSQSISTSCSSANRFAATRGDSHGGGGGLRAPMYIVVKLLSGNQGTRFSADEWDSNRHTPL